MLKHCKVLLVIAAVAAAGGSASPRATPREEKKWTPAYSRCGTYYANPGKMQALHARFRDHTNKLFIKHGMMPIGYWSPLDAMEADKKLFYVLAFPSKEAAEKSWEAFKNDPDWKAAKTASEKDGPLVARVESIFMKATDYSPIK